MSEKEVKTEVKPFEYGVAPSLLVNMVRDTRVYRFEMPVGAKLDECEEACGECLKIVQKMKADAVTKMEKAKLDKEKRDKEKEEKIIQSKTEQVKTEKEEK